MPKQQRILFVCSSGGHLDQLMALTPPPPGVHLAFATFLKPDAVIKTQGYVSYGLHWPSNRSAYALIRNTVIALRTLLRERPDLIVSSGAAAAVPFFYVGKAFFHTTNVFIECIDRVDNPTLTARLVRPVTDIFVTQWKNQLNGFANRVKVSQSK